MRVPASQHGDLLIGRRAGAVVQGGCEAAYRTISYAIVAARRYSIALPKDNMLFNRKDLWKLIEHVYWTTMSP